MELKTVITELGKIEGLWIEGSRTNKAVSAAAEALALVAWAEEQGAMVQRVRDRWMCSLETTDGISHYGAPTYLGAIRAAKEAYENDN